MSELPTALTLECEPNSASLRSQNELRSDECPSQRKKDADWRPLRRFAGTRVLAFGEDSLALRLTSELVDLRAANANLILRRFAGTRVTPLRSVIRTHSA